MKFRIIHFVDYKYFLFYKNKKNRFLVSVKNSNILTICENVKLNGLKLILKNINFYKRKYRYLYFIDIDTEINSFSILKLKLANIFIVHRIFNLNSTNGFFVKISTKLLFKNKKFLLELIDYFTNEKVKKINSIELKKIFRKNKIMNKKILKIINLLNKRFSNRKLFALDEFIYRVLIILSDKTFLYKEKYFIFKNPDEYPNLPYGFSIFNPYKNSSAVKMKYKKRHNK